MLSRPASLSTGALARVQLWSESGGEVRREAATFWLDGIPYLFSPHLSIHPSSIQLAAHLSVYSFTQQSICLSSHLQASIHLSFHLSFYLYTNPFVCPPTCPSVCIYASIYLFVHLSV